MQVVQCTVIGLFTLQLGGELSTVCSPKSVLLFGWLQQANVDVIREANS